MSQEHTAKEVAEAIANLAEDWAISCSVEAAQIEKMLLLTESEGDWSKAQVKRALHLRGMQEAYVKILNVARESALALDGIGVDDPTAAKGPF